MEAIWTLTLTGSLMALLVLLLRALLGASKNRALRLP